MSQPYSRVARLIQILVSADAKSAIEYVSPHKTIRVTRRTKLSRQRDQIEVVVRVGKPNYAERVYIKRRVAVGAPFPDVKVKPFKR